MTTDPDEIAGNGLPGKAQTVRRPAERKLAILTEFDGTRYAGWQRQENALAVQARMEQALTRVLGHPVRLTGCSRTDAGVHARGHVSHFLTTNPIPAGRLPLALLAALPPDISVLDARVVPADFHARFDARGKCYSYHIWNAPRPSAIRARFCLHEPRPLDTEAMDRAAAALVGRHDFTAFMAAGSTAKTTVRELYSARVFRAGDAVTVVVEGGGFLYNMMRIISGTLLYIGLGKLPADALPDIIASRRRTAAGKTLPARGLFLERVWYERPLFGGEGGQRP